MELHSVFNALGDPTRLAIVEQLIARGEASASELAEPFAMSKPAISRHLKVLEDAAIIERRIDRQYRRFRVRQDTLAAAGGWFEQASQFWSASLGRLEIHLSRTRREESSDER
ncbi:MAG: metalloregulator ArsR/SmtB family transcription factor [Notoacmeibacter sp.]|nr:metalloregulator ArsR/SmtB family transcription factor [Notoacmeibacter sp.]